MAKLTEKSELRRLRAVYAELPPKQHELAEGLIELAARDRVMLNEFWQDIQENGKYEIFQNGKDGTPIQRERPAVKLFSQYDKNYQAIIKQLESLRPPENSGVDKLSEFLNNG